MENYSKANKTPFLPSTQDGQLQSDYRVGETEAKCCFCLVAGGATITDGFLNFNLTASPALPTPYVYCGIKLYNIPF
jgi:hypothetical protein